MVKELNRFELAAIKRTAKNTKSLRARKEKLESKLNETVTEIKELQKQIDLWEEPIKTLTGGYTSEEVLNGVRELEMEELPEEAVVDDNPLDEIEVEKEEEIEEIEAAMTSGWNFN